MNTKSAISQLFYYVGLCLVFTTTFPSCEGNDSLSNDNEFVENIIPMTDLQFNEDQLVIFVGESKELVLSFSPINTTERNVTWRSSDPSIVTISEGVVNGISIGYALIYASCGDHTAKCYVSVTIPATSVSVEQETIVTTPQSLFKVSALFSPGDAMASITWMSSEESVVELIEVSSGYDGWDAWQEAFFITKQEGHSVITVTSGQLHAHCDVTVKPMPIPNPIDLGLSVKWASFNLCASSPEEQGSFFRWGETETYNRNLEYYWYSSESPSRYDSSDDTTLWLEDDAAHVLLRNDWRIPSKAEFEELLNPDNCNWEWIVSYNGKGGYGYLITSKKKGYTSSSIFLPMTDYTNGHILGKYWSSSLYGPCNAYCLSLSYYGNYLDNGASFSNRERGYAIRPVKP